LVAQLDKINKKKMTGSLSLGDKMAP